MAASAKTIAANSCFNMSIIVSGSLAYDRIMDFPGFFKDHILPDKIHLLNVSFAVYDLHQSFGGTAGNIAYNLHLLGYEPLILAAVGRDFEAYKSWLKAFNFNLNGLKVIRDKFTASAHIITDQDDNQITGFYAGAMDFDHLIEFDYSKIDPLESLAIISPAGKNGMMKRLGECQEKNIPYIFDPGQQITTLNQEELTRGIRGAKVLIGNDYEMEMIRRKTGLTQDKLLELSEMVITTKGGEGSIIETRGETFKIPIARPEKVVDPTGAGDAYRAGLIKGLIEKRPPEIVGRLAALAAVWPIEYRGTQEHHYTQEEFERRYEESFKI